MAQQIKTLADKPGGLSSVPGTQEVEGENWPLQVVLRLPHIYRALACIYTVTKGNTMLKH